MKNNKAIAPIVMGALTVGMTLVNNANAALVTGDMTATAVVESEIFVDAESNLFEWNDGLSVYGEDSHYVEIDSGEDGTGFSIHDYFQHETGVEQDEKHAAASLWSNFSPTLVFSTYFCDLAIVDRQCLNMLEPGVTIGENLFNGIDGEGHHSGYFYDEYTDLFSGLSIDNYSQGSWSNEGDSGYVAFAYSADWTSGVKVWEREDVQYGYLDVTRGSISINNVVIQGAPSTSVPESGSLMLLGLGLAGFAARRFKK